MPSRRDALASAAAVFGALAGCVSGDADTTTSTSTDHPSTTDRTTTTTVRGVSDVSFSWTSDPERDPAAAPVVSVDGGEVTVAGALWYGSSSCDRIVLERVDREDGDLRIRVGSGAVPDQPTVCTDDMAVGDYRVAVGTTAARPGRVVVVEAHAGHDVETHAVTLD